MGNNADTDDDGDGVADSADAFPLDATETLDTDGDGVGNNTDTDDDGDGVADVDDAHPLDPNSSAITIWDGGGWSQTQWGPAPNTDASIWNTTTWGDKPWL